MVNWSELDLPSGAALEWDDPEGALVWRVDRFESEWWLSSSALSAPRLPQDRQLLLMAAMLASHLRSDPEPGLRFYADTDGQIHLQVLLWRGEWASPPGESQAQAMQGTLQACRAACTAWGPALQGHSAPPALSSSAPASGSLGSSYRLLIKVLQADAELASGCYPIEDEGCIVIEPADESWSAAVLPCSNGRGAEVLMPLLPLPTDTEAAVQLLHQALSLNAGPDLSPDLSLALDSASPEGAVLMLRAWLPMSELRADDIKAAIGRQLDVAEALMERLAPDGTFPSARSLAVTGNPHLGMMLRG